MLLRITKKIGRLIGLIKREAASLRREVRYNLLGQMFPIKPTTINLMANDICNSKCEMCNIWKNEPEKTLSCDELRGILSDSLFDNLTHVGITGGEPSLNTNLADLVSVIVEKRSVVGVSVITNAVALSSVISRIDQCAQVCKAANKHFSVMVSIDGVGEVHNRVRGKSHNFSNAIQAFEHFKSQGYETSFGSTITKTNCMQADAFLDYAIEHNMYGRFRVAENINRLYNESCSNVIRNFSEIEKYNLALFFFRVAASFEPSGLYRDTYKNIRNMLFYDAKRSVQCPYQTNAVVLNSDGSLLYCSPKSPEIGNALELSAKDIYISNVDIRKKIISNHCDNCIHDYHGNIKPLERIRQAFARRRRGRLYNFDTLLKRAGKIDCAACSGDFKNRQSGSVLIVGWYGTETAGDKAILWSIADRLSKRKSPPETIYISSLYPFVTDWTLRELSLSNIKVVETYSGEFEKCCKSVDEIVVGGGPLMDLNELNHILYASIEAKMRNKCVSVVGCGLGPLNVETYKRAVKEILRLSDYIELRDSKSGKYANTESLVSDVLVTKDPAVDFVRYYLGGEGRQNSCSKKSNVIACYLRDWDQTYAKGYTDAEFQAIKAKFECDVAKEIAEAAAAMGWDICLYPMHTFYIGGDDRIFNRKFAKILESRLLELDADVSVMVANAPISPVEILSSMQASKFNICMRFHSVLFADQLDVPYIAIDYTNGGKIEAYLTDHGREKNMIGLEQIGDGAFPVLFREVLKNAAT